MKKYIIYKKLKMPVVVINDNRYKIVELINYNNCIWHFLIISTDSTLYHCYVDSITHDTTIKMCELGDYYYIKYDCHYDD